MNGYFISTKAYGGVEIYKQLRPICYFYILKENNINSKHVDLING
jgi:hypothetical protein